MYNLYSSTSFMQSKERIKLYIHFHVPVWDMPTINSLLSSAQLYSPMQRIKTLNWQDIMKEKTYHF
jgi:hypothetical protein